MNDYLLILLCVQVAFFIALTLAGKKEDANLRKRKLSSHPTENPSIKIQTRVESHSISPKKYSDRDSDSVALLKKLNKSQSNKKTQSEEELLNKILKDVLNIKK